MAYKSVSLDVTRAEFPFLKSLSGRTVVNAGFDEPKVTYNDIGIIYCENVLPIREGLQSVDYLNAVPEIDIPDGSYFTLLPYAYNAPELDVPYSNLEFFTLSPPYTQYGLVFSRILEIRSSGNLRAYIGITGIGTLFFVSSSSNGWVVINNGGWNPTQSDIDNVSVATLLVNETTETYICFPKFGIYLINIPAKLLTPIQFRAGSSIQTDKVIGICSSFNYLVLHDGNQLQWSSAFDPLDFDLTKAELTGTGFGTPIGLQGKIINIISNPGGFTVYSDANAVAVDWSSNSSFPWVFRPIPNSSGIKALRNVVIGQQNVNYAITNQGLQALVAQNATAVFPELTDFISYRTVETYDFMTNQVNEALGDLTFDIGYIGDRWFIFSYGLATVLTFTHAFVYDSSLKKWGKLVINHVDVLDYRLNQFNSSKNGLGFLLPTGEIDVISFDSVCCPINFVYPEAFNFSTPSSVLSWNLLNTKILSTSLNFTLTQVTSQIRAQNVDKATIKLTIPSIQSSTGVPLTVNCVMGSETISNAIVLNPSYTEYTFDFEFITLHPPTDLVTFTVVSGYTTLLVKPLEVTGIYFEGVCTKPTIIPPPQPCIQILNTSNFNASVGGGSFVDTIVTADSVSQTAINLIPPSSVPSRADGINYFDVTVVFDIIGTAGGAVILFRAFNGLTELDSINSFGNGEFNSIVTARLDVSANPVNADDPLRIEVSWSLPIDGSAEFVTPWSITSILACYDSPGSGPVVI
jgi:hypothetical protein